MSISRASSLSLIVHPLGTSKIKEVDLCVGNQSFIAAVKRSESHGRASGIYVKAEFADQAKGPATNNEFATKKHSTRCRDEYEDHVRLTPETLRVAKWNV